MAVLAVRKPVDSKLPALLVENKLPLGQHRFSLVVIDDRGLESAPDVLVVTVRKALSTGRLRRRAKGGSAV